MLGTKVHCDWSTRMLLLMLFTSELMFAVRLVGSEDVSIFASEDLADVDHVHSVVAIAFIKRCSFVVTFC